MCLVWSTSAQNVVSGPALFLKSGTQYLPENIRFHDQQLSFERAELLGGYYYRILQFHHIPSSAEKAAIAGLGVELLSYLPQNAYIAALPADISQRQLQRMGLRLVLPIRAEYKGRDMVIADLGEKEQQRIALQYHRNLQPALVDYLLKQSECEILAHYPAQHFVVLDASVEKIHTLSALPAVAYIEKAPDIALAEDTGGRGFHRSNVLFNAFPGGRTYDGSGVHVAIGDDGPIGPHIDFRGRTEQEAINSGQDGPHGEIVAGILTGAGNLNPRIQGMAPGAILHVYNRFDVVKTGSASPIHQEVVITSTSYGDGCNRGYTLFTSMADQQVRENGALIHVFSAGNSGIEDCGYGAGAGWGNITGGIKVGKNVLAVANLNTEDQRVNNSSRGPSTDGRIKPDISANGSGQLSTAPNNTYAPATGTSAAAPGVAGVLAQLYQAYRELNDGNEPESALMKACILNTADDLGPKGPDFSYGWGRINARRALGILEQKNYQSSAVEQGQWERHELLLEATAAELRVMIYWHDVEGSSLSGRDLINDLDLLLVSPQGDTLQPWVLDPTPDPKRLAAAAGRGVDRLNNMEQVTLVDAPAGRYELLVQGTSIPEGPQSYYLVYEQQREEVVLTYPYGGEHLVPGEMARLHWDAYGNTEEFRLSFSVDDGNSWELIDQVPGHQRMYEWTVPDRVGGLTRVKVSRGASSDVSKASFSIFNIPDHLQVDRVCPRFTRLSWNVVEEATAYVVYRLGEHYMDSIATVTNTNIDILNYDPSIEQWYSVQAIGADGARSRRAVAVSDGIGLMDCEVDIDVGLVKINSPATVTYQNCFDNALPVSVNIKNTGSRLRADFPVCYQLDGQAVVCEQYDRTIPSGITINYTFDCALAGMATGEHQLKIWTAMPEDEAVFNDTLVQYLRVSDSELIQLPYFEYFEDFPFCPSNDQCIGSCALAKGWTNAKNRQEDHIDWRVSKGPTPTYGTGPSTDQNTRSEEGQYLYLEGSGGCYGRQATLMSPCFDLSNVSNPVLSFWYHMYGADMGELRVHLFEGQEWHSNIVLPIEGDQGNRWQKALIDLSSLAGKSVSIQFAGTTGTSYLTDIAIDNVALFDANSPPVSAFTVSQLSSCPGEEIQLSDNSFNSPTEWLWEFSPANSVVFLEGTSAASPNPKIYFTSEGLYSVSLTTSNSFGSNQTTSVSFISIFEGMNMPVKEDFELPTALASRSWTVNNPDDFISWAILPVIGKSGTIGKSIYVANHSYNVPGQRDELVSEAIDLTDARRPYLRFDYSYSEYTSQYKDELQVLLAPDCGDLFTQYLFNKKGADLSTVDFNSTNWLPRKGSDWQTAVIDLGDYVGQSVMLKFVNICGFGNNLYLDNILVYEEEDFPQANFSLKTSGDSLAICTAATVQFESTTVGGQDNVYTWDFGEAAMPRQASGPGPHEVQYTQAGNYFARLKVSNTLGQSESWRPVEITPSTTAAFSFEIQQQQVEFFNESIAADSFYWDFGDGEFSTSQHPVHDYASDSSYTVRLEAYNACGSAIFSQEIKVTTSIAQPTISPGIRVYPNPAQSTLFFSSDDHRFQRVAVAIYDLRGQLLFHREGLELGLQQVQPLDITALVAGTYFLRISNGVEVQTRRVLIYR
ncbi:MAG: S8 family serine peptidase [Bacteroidota bacterium]